MSLRFYLGLISKILNLSLSQFIELYVFQNHGYDSLSLILQIIPKHFACLQIFFYLFFLLESQGLFGRVVRITLSYFKQHYTHFYTLFHSHVYQKHVNNIIQTSLLPLLTKAQELGQFTLLMINLQFWSVKTKDP